MIWRPWPFQERVLERQEFEVLAGGARGPGKTDAGLVWLTDEYQHPRYRALVIRKNADDLADWIDRAIRLYSGLGATITHHPTVITFPSGAIIRTGHLKDDQAYTKYQGQEFHRMLIEELTQIPDERRYLQLIASCRSTIPALKPQILCTTNPGGVGHGWVKRRFVDPSPAGRPFQDPTSRRWRIFLPGKIEDNPSLMQADPEYIKQLDALKDTDIELWRAWRLGDWDTFAGQFFKEFRRDRHVVQSVTPKKDLTKVAGLDWGRTAPFVFLAVALQVVKLEDGRTFNRAWVYDEIDGTDKNPKEWAEQIKARHDPAAFAQMRGDPAMFTKGQDTSISIADQFLKEGIRIRPASNDRVGGWSVVHDWLSLAPDGLPYLLFMERCHHTITTLPELVHDETKVEDVDTAGPDHHGDALRYILKHVKWIDARLGGVQYKDMTLSSPKRLAEVTPTGQKSLDLDKFSRTGQS